MMKVLQVIDALRSGGAEGFVTNLGVSLRQLGVDVRFFLTTGVHGVRGQALLERLQEAGVGVSGIEVRSARSLGNLVATSRLVRTWRPDIVQANLYSAEMLSAATKALRLSPGTRYVRRLADTNIRTHRSPWMLRQLDRRFSATIACSPAVAEAYRAFMGGKCRSQVVAIPNGGVLRDHLPDNEEKRLARTALGIPEHAFVVAHIGRMSGGVSEGQAGIEGAQKAHDVLIEAFGKAFAGDKEAVLLCVGDGPLKPDLMKLAARLGLNEQARFLGVLPEPWGVLTAADVFLFPSRHEGLPNVLPEAASCGLPVIASDIPENTFLNPGDAWKFAPVNDVDAFADAMLLLRGNLKAFTHHAREAAPGFREKFSMERCAANYLRCYQDILRSSCCESE